MKGYAGAIGGIATSSGDAGSQRTTTGLQLSSYAPRNGGALNVFAGIHLHNYFSLQGSYMWNQNKLIFNSASSDSSTFYRQQRSSTQQAGVVDFLVYFRPLKSRIRPYLGTGLGVVHLSSEQERIIDSAGMPQLPPAVFRSNRAVLRSHVGIDVMLSRRIAIRYSFSDLIGANDISKHLSPPGPRILENFQNLFGFVVHF